MVYGKIGTNKDGTARSAKCIHGGAAFIVPIIQSYAYLDLTAAFHPGGFEERPVQQNIRIDVPSDLPWVFR